MPTFYKLLMSMSKFQSQCQMLKNSQCECLNLIANVKCQNMKRANVKCQTFKMVNVKYHNLIYDNSPFNLVETNIGRTHRLQYCACLAGRYNCNIVSHNLLTNYFDTQNMGPFIIYQWGKGQYKEAKVLRGQQREKYVCAAMYVVYFDGSVEGVGWR